MKRIILEISFNFNLLLLEKDFVDNTLPFLRQLIFQYCHIISQTYFVKTSCHIKFCKQNYLKLFYELKILTIKL